MAAIPAPPRSHNERSEEGGPLPATDYDARHYWDKRLNRRWSLNGVGLIKLSHRYNQWMYRVRRAVFRRAVRRLPVNLTRSSVLDIASGTGFYVALWQRLGVQQVTGADIADSAVERLRKRFPDVRFERTDVSDELPFEEGSFDLVSAFDVLFHIVDDERYRQAIDNIHTALRPDGWFVLSEHFALGKKGGPKHYKGRTREEIDTLLDQAGFEVVSQRPGFILMAPPYGASSEWRWKLWNEVMKPVLKRERLGGLLGAALYPVEITLTRLRKQPPGTKVIVCRKRS